eukprot:TRINITY_DN2436_c0_g1_i1.p1 TRINITY_DN2436_c0_g1~~TRINITY_DN2436_c0_g1_i1.p1  ORF type:complete len:485 (+),score=138.62 TRINITY_DN2436_c0_g1_i1:617-2071(+)
MDFDLRSDEIIASFIPSDDEISLKRNPFEENDTLSTLSDFDLSDYEESETQSLIVSELDSYDINNAKSVFSFEEEVEKDIPTNDLACTPSKIKLLNNSLKKFFQIKTPTIILLTGPSGSGKFTSLKAICKENNYELIFEEEIVLTFNNEFISREFVNLKEKIFAYNRPRLFFSNKKVFAVRIEQVETNDLFKIFLKQILKFSKSLNFPIVLILTLQSTSTIYKIFDFKILNDYRFKHVEYKAISDSKLKRALQRYCIMNSINLSSQVLGNLVDFAKGDIRKAINQLTFFHSQIYDVTSDHVVTNHHFVAKVLYNNRSPYDNNHTCSRFDHPLGTSNYIIPKLFHAAPQGFNTIENSILENICDFFDLDSLVDMYNQWSILDQKIDFGSNNFDQGFSNTQKIQNYAKFQNFFTSNKTSQSEKKSFKKIKPSNYYLLQKNIFDTKTKSRQLFEQQDQLNSKESYELKVNLSLKKRKEHLFEEIEEK